MTENDDAINSNKIDDAVDYIDAGSITMADVYAQLLDLNEKLNILIDINQWVGKYDSIERDITPHTERGMYKFKFPVRYLKIDSNQNIILQLNDIGNSPITLSTTDMPFIMEDMVPNMIVHTIYITTGSMDTHIRIWAMG